jgi:PAS domain S-box-containing protein
MQGKWEVIYAEISLIPGVQSATVQRTLPRLPESQRAVDRMTLMNAKRPVRPNRSSGKHVAAEIMPSASLPHGVTAQDLSARDRAALAAALDPIITIDALGTIQSASDSVHRVLGWKAHELLGQNVSILMPEPHHSGHDGYLAHYHRTGQTNIMNRPRRFEALRKDGALVPIELCVSRAEIAGGGPPLFVGIIRDMSAYAAAERSRDEERIRSQQLLAEQTSALQQANLRLRMSDRMASIGTLAAGLGHDMNNVLLPVRARLNALRASGDAGKIPGSERKHVEEIRKSVAYLQQLADGLHFLALDPENVDDTRAVGTATDLRQWWSQAGALLSKAVPKHVRVSASFPADLPLVTITAHGLTQAVLNLVVNAGEAIPVPHERRARGLVRVWGKVSEGPAGAWVRLGVTDNGSGMSDDVKRRAVEMFFTTKPRGLGTGLGLALVRKVAEQAGGRVEIESKIGKGTSVVLIIPAARPSEQSSGGPEGPSAIISVNDGRAAAIIRHVLEASGAVICSDRDSSRADMWVVSPRTANVAEVRAWKAHRQRGTLVLFGNPDPQSRANWQALRPVTIADTDDFDAVRTALERAIAAE